jgi:hypothetical protein
VKYPAYPKYKPSGVEWLGEVPEHWEVKRMKFMLSQPLKYGANESAEIDDPDLPRYIRITDIDEDGSLRNDTFRSLPWEVAAPFLLQDGDLLFARSGATSGKSFLYNKDWGICAYAGYLIRARLNQSKAVPQFVRHFTSSISYWQWLSSIYIQATIQNVSAEKYADLQIPQRRRRPIPKPRVARSAPSVNERTITNPERVPQEAIYAPIPRASLFAYCFLHQAAPPLFERPEFAGEIIRLHGRHLQKPRLSGVKNWRRGRPCSSFNATREDAGNIGFSARAQTFIFDIDQNAKK